MWLFTDKGMVSVVKHYGEADTVVVRARDKITLMEFCPTHAAKIQTTLMNDYQYRIHMTKPEFSEVLADYVDEMEYPNFKDQVKKVNPSMLPVYYRVYNNAIELGDA